MAQQARPVDRELMDEPHVAGRRVSVVQLHAQVDGAGRHPADVADQLDLDVGDVYAALAYYYEHPEEMAEIRDRRDSRRERLRGDRERSTRRGHPAGVAVAGSGWGFLLDENVDRRVATRL